MPDLETQLRSYSEHLDQRYPEVTFEEIVGRRIKPRAPLRPVRVRRGLTVALASAFVVLLVVGGLALLLFGGEEAPVVTTPEPPPTTSVPEPSPEGSGESQPVETSMGTWVWTRFDGNAAEAEQMWLELVEPLPSEEPLALEVEYPVQYPYPDDQYSDGLTWHTHGLAGFAQFGGTTAMVGSIGIAVDWEAVYGDEIDVWWDFESGRLRVERQAADRVESLAALVVSVTEVASDLVAMEFHDEETGELVLRLEGVDPNVAETFLAYPYAPSPPVWEAEVWLLFADQGDGVGVWVEPPWQGMLVGSADVAVGPNGLVVAAVARPSLSSEERTSLLYLWGSRDGVVWEQLGSPISLDVDHAPVDLVGDGDRLVMLLADALWTSTDGSDWQKVEANIGSAGYPQYLAPTGFGWAYVDGSLDEGKCKVWVSLDGVAWEQIPFAPRLEPQRAGAAGCRLQGDRVAAMSWSEGGSGSVWIGGFER